MRVTVEQIDLEREEELIVRCHDHGAAWVQSVQEAASGRQTVCGWREDEMHQLKLSDVFYFETVDDMYSRQRRSCTSLSGFARAAHCSGAASP